MITTPQHTATRGEDDFRTGEGLRAFLTRLHAQGAGSWRRDPTAAELMAFTAEKYAALAHKHGLDAWEAAGAAFDVMRTRVARTADDPWAVVTHAVRITCIAEQRAQGLLCSVHQARRPQVSRFHDPERFSERENLLADYHPAFHVHDQHAGEQPDHGDTGLVSAVVEDAVSWTGLLRVLLGSPDAAYSATGRGQGILLRLLLGERLADLLADDELVALIVLSAPGGPGVRGA